MAIVTLDRVKVRKGSSTVLDIGHLIIDDGELLAILGPSGAGKSMLLRAIAGLEDEVQGAILFDGQDMTDITTGERGVAMVFQDQALYPFLNVRENVGFPLKIRKAPAAEIDARVEAEARVLEIEHLLARRPAELGAGHQQLVQAARALVRVPEVFLMDEPFARLDAHLRDQMRQEFRLLQQGYGVTTVFVTNDHHEAMVMADRVAVIDAGAIRQIGPPLDLYRQPGSKFVAELVGPMNFVRARLVADKPGYWLELGSSRIRAWTPSLEAAAGTDVDVGVRPEDVVEDRQGIDVVVVRGYFAGSHGMAQVSLATGRSVMMRTEGPPPDPGNALRIRLRRLHVFDPRTGSVLGHVEDGAG